MEVIETRLPGLGVRYEFTTEAGDHLGVVVRRDGRRELVLYDPEDPDAGRDAVALSNRESAALVELLGGTRLTQRLTELSHDVEGLSIEWFTLPETGGLDGVSIGDMRLRAETGASIVAVIRGETSFPGPGAEFRVQGGDVVLVIGAVHSVQAAARRLLG